MQLLAGTMWAVVRQNFGDEPALGDGYFREVQA